MLHREDSPMSPVGTLMYLVKQDNYSKPVICFPDKLVSKPAVIKY